MILTALHEAPNGTPGEACATKQFEMAEATLDRAAVTLQFTRAKVVSRRGMSGPARR